MKLQKLKTKELVVLSLLVALSIVMGDFAKIRIIPKVLELSFGFVPLALCGMLFGPVPALAVGVMSDVVGALLSGVEFFPGYTLTALCTGLFYGLFLHKKETRLRDILIAQALVSLVCYAGLNTLWAYVMGYGKSMQYVTTRLVVNLVAYPVYVLVLYVMKRYRKPLEGALR